MDEMPPVENDPGSHDEVVARLATLLSEADPGGDPVEFLGRRFDLGLAWVHLPRGLGGLGADRTLQRVVDQRLQEAGAPDPAMCNVVGHGMAAPTLAAYADPDRQRRHLRPLFTGQEIWCQLFSEPGAGSDLAGLATRAVADGDDWVLNGQKVWTSYAHRARWGLLLARTDPALPKHRGLTYFVLDMAAPGVDVRPLVQLTGEAEFNEVYLTDVRVPDRDRLGEVNGGWRVALTTLMNERVAIGAQLQPRNGGAIAGALDAWTVATERSDAQRDRLVALWIEAEALRLMNARSQQRAATGTPGPEGSVGKLFAAEHNQRVTEFALELLGPAGALQPGGYPVARTSSAHTPAPAEPSVQKAFLRARANSIEGGTSEVLRNVLAERVLGLPADLRVDRDVAWSAVRRS